MKFLGGDIYEGDCLEVMKKIPDQSVDMILCDLPYGTTQNKWDSIIPLDLLWKEYERIIKPKGVIALTSQGIFTAKLILSNEAWFKYKFVWVKSKATNFLNAKRQPLRQHEDICIFYKKQPDYYPVMWKAEPYNKGTRKSQFTGSYGDFKPVEVKSEGERYPTDTIYCKTAESEEGGRVWHPTQKPVALGRYLIRMFTKEGDVVLDNAFGSGSFLVASALEGRRYIGIEKNEEVHLFKKQPVNYIEVAKLRLAEVKEKMDNDSELPPLFSFLQPNTRGETIKKGVDINAIIDEAEIL
ncbi:site-specific DNA-methyltransferase (plasmid) [Moraxella sp. K23]